MTTKLNTNGQARKSLAEQIDRLDEVLDGLAEGINDTVVAAVKEAVGAAVQAVLREVLSSPELLARLAVAVPTATHTAEKPKVNWRQRWFGDYKGLRTWLAAACAACGRGLASVRQECGRRLGQARSWAVGALLQFRLLGQFKYQLVTALAVGLSGGVAVYFAGPWLAATAGGVGAFAATLAVQAGVALKRWLTQIAGPVT
jgi:hypothetical protein